MEKEPYNQRDHIHCFDQKVPACGIAIASHKVCCLCEKPMENKETNEREENCTCKNISPYYAHYKNCPATKTETPKCFEDENYMYCWCGKCKPEDYELPNIMEEMSKRMLVEGVVKQFKKNCVHEWIDATNEKVTGTKYCNKCKTIESHD
jgi:hypothetical protein